MTLYSSGLFSIWTASGCIENLSRLPASPSLPVEKTLAFGTTIHFVRGSNKALIIIVLSAMAVNILEKFSTSVVVYNYNCIEVKTGFVESFGM